MALFAKKKKTTKNKDKKTTNSLLSQIPKTVQESIPYIRVYKDGIIETEPGVFTKSYALEDINFQLMSREEQIDRFQKFSDLLNSFGHEVNAQIVVFNRNIDEGEFRDNTLLKLRNDGMDEYRQEYNEMLQAKLTEGSNNLMHEKYLTLAIKSDDIEKAINLYARIEPEVVANIKKINQCDTEALTLVERLEILYEAYHIGSPMKLYKKEVIDGKEVETFNPEWTKKMDITTKDLIGPMSMEFKSTHFKIDDKYGRTVFLDNLPSFMTADILADLADAPLNMLTSVHFESLETARAMKMVRNQLVNINSNVVEAQKKAFRSHYSPELVSFSLQQNQAEANSLLEDITGRNQKLFYVTVTITHFADSLAQLEDDTSTITSIAGKHLCQIKNLRFQQEYGLNTTLPLCTNKLHIKRLLTTEAASVFIPFATQGINQPNGMYYGQHTISKRMILLNRMNLRNGNGLILGTPGSGKSFAAKREMVNVLLNTDADVFVIDPEGEYIPMAEMFGGQVVRVAPGSGQYINPLDMDLNYGDDDPVVLKSDFMFNLCETALGSNYMLSPVHKSVIDRCVKQVYDPYLKHMKTLESQGVTYDADAMPTLQDFYEILLSQPEPEAKNMALALEIYITGSLDSFAHRTNVDNKARFVVYDIKDIGSGMKEMGLQVCLNDIWNKTIANKNINRRTWFYIDEFHLLLQTDSSAIFLQEIFKRARKWGGIPTGLTQNVEDMLSSKETRTIISNSDFIMMLNQAPIDRAELAHMLNISNSLVSYITNSDQGCGLVYTGKTIIPFTDKFPSGTKLYDAMTTKPGEGVDKEKGDQQELT